MQPEGSDARLTGQLTGYLTFCPETSLQMFRFLKKCKIAEIQLIMFPLSSVTFSGVWLQNEIENDIIVSFTELYVSIVA